MWDKCELFKIKKTNKKTIEQKQNNNRTQKTKNKNKKQ